MTRIIDAAFSRVRVILAAFFVLILFGFYAFNTISREAEPDIQAPFVVVSLPLPGVSPEDAERLLIRPAERELQSIEGLLQMDAIAFDGVGQIIIEFTPTADIDQAVSDVREAVDRAKAEFPTDAEEPVVDEFNIQNQFPMTILILHGPVDERTLYQTALSLSDRLETNPGVLEAKLIGAREELLEVLIDPEVLESYALTESEVINAVTTNNRLVTAGVLDFDDGSYQIKLPGLIKTASDLATTPVRVNGDNVVTIADLARVRRTFVDADGYAVFDGNKAIGIALTKRSGANIVETIDSSIALADEVSRQWNAPIKYTVLSNRSVFVEDSLGGLTASVLSAIMLVMIVVVAALGVRSAIMVGIAIPTSFLIGFFLLSASGYTLNMMVMFGLVLSVGMLVDGAIVIVEYADRRMNEGATRRIAYLEASKRMFWPVITSTATTLAAFIPFLFWKSTPGEFMKYLPLTLMYVLMSSLFVALVFLPVLGSVLGTPQWMKNKFGILGKTDGPKEIRIEDVDPTTLKTPTGFYARFIAATLRHPILSVAAVLCLVGVSFLSFRLSAPEVEFFVRSDNEEINVLVLARGNLSEIEKLNLTEEVARRIEDHAGIESVFIQSGADLSQGRDTPAEIIGQVSVDLLPYVERVHSRQVLADFREMVRGVPGVVVEVRQRESGPPIGKDVQVELSSFNNEAMLQAAKKVRDFVDGHQIMVNGREINAFMDSEDTLPLPGLDWNLSVDRALAGRYGVSVSQAGGVMQFVTDGLRVGQYRPDDADEEIDIRVRYPEDKRDIFALDSLRVQTPSGAVPASNFIKREARPQVDRITRRNGRRIVEVKANGNTNVKGHEVSQNVAIAETRQWLNSGVLGDDVNWIMRGADEETNDAAQFFIGAMAAAMFMIALILLLEFNSFYHALLTLSAVVLSVFGVLLGIALTGQYVSVIMTGTGVVALAGIVVNNNIVLIDTYQQLRRTGLTVENAVIRTAAQRIRPVLLTTITTILGLLPMVFEINLNFVSGEVSQGSSTSGWWVLLSSAVVYGLAFSTVLTLIFTPVMLAAPTVIRRSWGNWMSGARKNSLDVDTDAPIAQAAE